MNILIVEDDHNKLNNIQTFLHKSITNIVITKALSFHSGSSAAISQHFDLIILDMSIPSYDITNTEQGGPPLAFGGKAVLRQLSKHNVKSKVIVITQFETFGEGDRTITAQELDLQLKELFPDLYTGLIFYNSAFESWKDELINTINALFGTKE